MTKTVLNIAGKVSQLVAACRPTVFVFVAERRSVSSLVSLTLKLPGVLLLLFKTKVTYN